MDQKVDQMEADLTKRQQEREESAQQIKRYGEMLVHVAVQNSLDHRLLYVLHLVVM